MSLRLSILNALVPVSKAVGKMHAPFSHKEVTGKHVYDIEPHLGPGMVLLSYIRGEVSNLAIPGEFTHAAMVVSDKEVIEASGAGVQKKDLITFMTSKDRVALLHPKFCGAVHMSLALKYAEGCLGAPYDFVFTPGNKAFYCSELIQHAYEQTTAPGTKVIFTRRTSLGIATVLPVDFYLAKEKWALVWDSKKV